MDANKEDQDHGEYERTRSHLFGLEAEIERAMRRTGTNTVTITRGKSLREEFPDREPTIDLEIQSLPPRARRWR